jgi:hypothetical protein
MAAPSAQFHHKLSVLPPSLHYLAVEGAFFSIFHRRTLSMDFDSSVGRGTAIKLLHAAATATRSLKKIDLKHIPVRIGKPVLELISVACKSASDVRLDYGHRGKRSAPDLEHIMQLGAALSHNAALTSLHFTIQGQPRGYFDLNCLTVGLTGLQSLSMNVGHSCPL